MPDYSDILIQTFLNINNLGKGKLFVVGQFFIMFMFGNTIQKSVTFCVLVYGHVIHGSRHIQLSTNDCHLQNLPFTLSYVDWMQKFAHTDFWL
jgi:hypothetical protein